MKNLIIIPAYNEQESIEKTVEDIKANAPRFDYIVVNDCSKDNTGKICREKKYNVINLPVNLGIGGAVQTGYRYAWKNGYETAVQVDGDGQHDPKFLEMMLTYLEKENADMVIGSRFITKEGFQSSGLRRVGIRYFTWLIHLLTGKTITDPTSGLRMVNRSVIQQYASCYPKDYPEPESVVTILKEEKKVKEVPVIMRERAGGVSSISPMKSIYYMIKVTLAILIEKIYNEEETMQVRLQMVFGVVLLLFMIAVVHMIRKRYLEIKYALSWFMTLVFLMIVDVFPGILSFITAWVGVELPSNMLFILGFCFLMGIVLNLTVELSKLSVQNKTLIQEMGIMEKKIRQLEEN